MAGIVTLQREVYGFMKNVYEYDKEALVRDMNEIQSDWWVQLDDDGYLTIQN